MVQTLPCPQAAPSLEDDVRVIRIRLRVPPAPTSSTTPSESCHVPAVYHDLDGGLSGLSEDIFIPCDVALLTSHDKNRAYVSLTPSYVPAEDHDDIIFYEDEQGYAEVAGAIVDDCDIYFYCANANSPPPFTCMASGRYIGIFSGQDYVPMVEGISHAVFLRLSHLRLEREH
ncbi:hypothetical protein F4604DRAFT_1685787 [Suillus subluteus]|nr:hypothetical protein F4604DRAFT_1685787 [Suillus subluteus]